MNGDLDNNQLRALFGALTDGTIPEEDHARLEHILATSEEARQQWFLHCDIETGMAEWAAMRRESSQLAVMPFHPGVVRPARKSWPLRKWFVPLAAAALVMLAAVWWLIGFGKHSLTADTTAYEMKVSGVAVLSRAVGVVWDDGGERASGTVLEAGRLRLKSGAALVEFNSGARVVLEGPVDFQLISAGEAFLHKGKINAHVPPQAKGFTVGSGSVKVVDYGTDFGFTVGNDTAPEVHVFTGKVEVASAKLAPQALGQGEAVRFSAGQLAPIPAVRTAFLTEEELTRRDAEAGFHRLADWRKASQALNMEPATVVHFTFEEADSVERRITNHSANASPSSQGGIVGSAWTDGRWPGKRAIDFRSGSDRVRFTAEKPQQALTFIAWVKIESLPRWQNVLLASDSDMPGALRWHLTRHGELRLEIARDLGRVHSDWEAVNSTPFVTANRFGQWLMLATTFDGHRICHYANGHLIGSGPSFTPPALHIGNAQVGNWNGDTQRQLSGAVDEFTILSRSMTAEEIQAQYEAGKP